MLAGVLSALMGMLLLCGCSTTVPIDSNGIAMGTVVSMRVYGEKEEFTNLLWDKVDDLEHTLLSKRIEESEVSVLNRAIAAGEETVSVSEELLSLLTHGKNIWQDSEGAFDLTLGSLTGLWNIDELTGTENPGLPGKEEIDAAKEKAGFGKCLIENTSVTVEDKLQFDLGAVGKGLALDEIRELLTGRKVSAAVISMGGSVLTYGEKPDGTAFKVAIVNPLKPEERIGYLEIQGTKCISTSGSYERYIEVDGTRYHHILDPTTGYPANNGVASVTIVSDNGFESDALSTACYILGIEKGMELATKYHAQALFVLEDGDITMSSELEGKFVKE